MKKYFSFALLMTLLALFVSSSDIYAQPGKGMGQGKCCAKFVDANGDGKCDNFVDANNDGKCDNCTGAGQCDGTKKNMGNCGKGMGQGKCCAKFVDANGDGKCDSFVDANNDGKCDNCTGAGQCDGTKKNMGNCGKGMKNGQGMMGGKGNCGKGKSCKMNGSNTQSDFSVEQNVPNPFNGITKIPFNLKNENFVKIVLFDNSGNQVKSIFEGKLAAGDHEVEFNSTGIIAGSYIYTITVGGIAQSRQLVIVK